MVDFRCHVCKTRLQAEPEQIGKLVRCPTCMTTLRVPTRAAATPAAAQAELVGAGSSSSAGSSAGASSVSSTTPAAPTLPSPTAPQQRRVMVPPQFRTPGGGKKYGFNCGYCSSRLEATESMAGQEGQCPTCGKNIVIPILDRYGRLIDPMTGKIIKQDPHPVHAYAAAGERAPRILRQPNGTQVIQCPRCQSLSAISSNNCKSCGMPFTMEGTTLDAAGANNGMCVASLVLGIIGIFAVCTFIVPVLALVLGIIGYNQASGAASERKSKGMAIAGIVLGSLELLGFAYWVFS